MTLQAFVDDSGSGGDTKVFALAGFVANAELWKKFSDDWDAILGKDPPIPYFKMYDAARETGVFEGWPVEHIDRKVEEFVSTIIAYNGQEFFSVHAALLNQDYETTLRGRVPEETDEPYLFLMSGIMTTWYIHQRDHNLNEPTDFIFDSQSTPAKKIRDLWDYAVLNAPVSKDLFQNEPILRDDKVFKPLQAADINVWKTRRDKEGKHYVRRSLRPILDRLDGVERIGVMITRVDLADHLAGVEFLRDNFGPKPDAADPKYAEWKAKAAPALEAFFRSRK